MKNQIEIPDSYFDDEEFSIEDLNEDEMVGVLGPNPSTDQVIKYELCRIIADILKKKELSNSVAGKITGHDAGDISRLLNFRIDRFTIERLIKILSSLEDTHYVWKSFKNISDSGVKRTA